MTALLHRLRPRLIHAHHYEALVVAHWVMKRQRVPVPIVFHQHARFAPELPTYGHRRLAPALALAGNWCDLVLPHLADHVIAINNGNLRALLDAGVPTEQTSLIVPSAAIPDESRHHPTPHPRIVAGYIGNLDDYQGLNNLFDALACVPVRYRHRLQLRLITDNAPPRIPSCVRPYVSIVPHGTFPQAMRQLTNCDCLVVPRHLPGGVPIKVINAMAAGLPVIANNKVMDMLCKEDALLVDTRDPAALSHALLTLSDNPNLRQDLHSASLRCADGIFSHRAFTTGLKRAYETAVAPPKSAPGTIPCTSPVNGH